MKTAKTIEELYKEAKEFDVVITVDAALATALNARVDEPRLNGFAYTAKEVAAMREGFTLGCPVMSDLDIVHAIMKDTDLDFKSIYSEILNIRDIRKYTEDVEKYLHSARSRKVWASYRLLPTRERSMADYEYRDDAFFKGKKVATIGLDFFNDLDKHMYSDSMEIIEPFKDGDYEIDTVYAIGNDRQIADSIVDLVKDMDPTDVAIVLDSDSPVADAVRAALYRNEIPFKNNLSVKDLSQVRDFLQFINLAHGYGTLRVSDVRDLFSGYGARDTSSGNGLKTQFDNYLLSKVPIEEPRDPVTVSLIETMRDIGKYTYGEALERIVGDRKYLKHLRPSIEILLKDLDIFDEKITPGRTNEIIYAVNNVEDLRHNEQIPDDEKQGVLLADCRNSAYVDRPLVVFAGMDSSWDINTSGKDYVDPQAEAEKNADRMGILLQQGDCRIYAIKPMTDGKATQPCRHIIDLFVDRKGNPVKKIGGFRDICREYRKGSWYAETEVVFPSKGTEGFESSDESDKGFSKSKYNAFSDCPIKYLYDGILKSEDNEYTVFGNCLHDFAEMYFCYPDVVKKKGAEYYLNKMDSLYSGLSSECMEGLDRSRFSIFISNLMKYIDQIRPADVPLDMMISDRKERFRNRFMVEEGLERCSSLTESEMDVPEHMYAKFDARVESDIFDYKTGKPKSGDDILKGFDRGSDNFCEFQPLIYLAVLSRNSGMKSASFNLLFVGDNEIESTGEGFDINRNVRRVKLMSQNHDDLVFSDDSPVRRAYASKKGRKISEKWDEIVSYLKEMSAYDGWQDSEECIDHVCKITGYKESSVKNFLKKMSDPYVIDDEGTAYVPADSMEDFIERLNEDYREALRIRTVPFSTVRPGNLDCKKCSFRKACMATERKTVSEGEE